MTDPLCDVIALLRPHAVFSKSVTGKGPWGIRYAPYDTPSFSIVLKGRCWIAIEGSAPLLLERGDFMLLPTSPAFRMYSEPGTPCVMHQPLNKPIRHGDPEGEPDLHMLGGTFEVEPANASLMLQLLPGFVHIRAVEGDTSRFARITALIVEEGSGDRPGREMVLERLLEVMLIETLRRRSLDRGAMHPGLLAGLRDPAIASALRAMHSDVRRGWTVAEMARHVGMSRSAFAARFAEIVGCAPMEYLSRWRISLAQDALSNNRASLDRVAEDIGYQSTSAFSTAFRRRTGYPPGAFARGRHHSDRTPVKSSA